MIEPEALVVGGSAGALDVLTEVLPALPPRCRLAIAICLHRASPGARSPDLGLAAVLGARCSLPVREAVDKAPFETGVVYLAPAGYHLLIETDRHLALSVDTPVNYSRPAIDVLFESAAAAYGARLVAVLLSGANTDGRDGLLRVRERGGHVVVQSPRSAGADAMPQAAVSAGLAERILDPRQLARYLRYLTLGPADARLDGGSSAAGFDSPEANGGC